MVPSVLQLLSHQDQRVDDQRGRRRFGPEAARFSSRATRATASSTMKVSVSFYMVPG